MSHIELEVSEPTRAYYELSRKIRHAEQPNNTLIISDFLSLPPLSSLKNKAVQRAHSVAQFQLLMDTIADEYLPSHWRCQCLDYIYRPLQSLQGLANCQQSRQQLRYLNYELQLMSHYLQAGLVAS
ncbi:MAG: hypothetical protein AB1Y36_08825 [Cycloclasticus sp.]